MIIAAVIGLAAELAEEFMERKRSTGFAKNLREAMFKNIQTFSFANIDKFSNSRSCYKTYNRCYKRADGISDDSSYVKEITIYVGGCHDYGILC